MPKRSDTTSIDYALEGDTGLFDAMAKEVHVDLRQLADGNSVEAVARARERCLNCDVGEKCERWLDTSVGIPFPPAFCPNAPFFHLCIAAAHDETFDPP